MAKGQQLNYLFCQTSLNALGFLCAWQLLPFDDKMAIGGTKSSEIKEVNEFRENH